MRKNKDTNVIPYKNRPDIKFKHGLRCELDLANIDGRTRLGKTISWLKTELYNFVGINTVASELLINQIIYKTIKLNFYTKTKLQNISNEEANHYLPLSNSLRLDLMALSQLSGKPKPPDLQDYIRTTYGSKDKS